MAQPQVNDNINLGAAKFLDDREGKIVAGVQLPYASFAEATNKTEGRRPIGLQVRINTIISSVQADRDYKWNGTTWELYDAKEAENKATNAQSTADTANQTANTANAKADVAQEDIERIETVDLPSKQRLSEKNKPEGYLGISTPSTDLSKAALSDDGTKILNIYDVNTGVPFNATKYMALPDGVLVDNAIWFTAPTELGGGFAMRDFDEGELNVKWFGAKGDGTNDDSIAINKCIEYSFNTSLPSSRFGLNVNVPDGIYNLSQAIKIRKNVNIIFGDNARLVAISAMEAVITTDASESLTYQQIWGGRFDCNRLADRGFWIKNSQEFKMYNCYVINPLITAYHIGTSSSTSYGLDMNNCIGDVERPHPASTYGLLLENTTDSFFCRLVLSGFSTGVRYSSGGSSEFINVHAWARMPEQFMLIGFDINSFSNSFTNCVADNPSQNGIIIRSGRNSFCNSKIFINNANIATNTVTGILIKTGVIGVNLSDIMIYGNSTNNINFLNDIVTEDNLLLRRGYSFTNIIVQEVTNRFQIKGESFVINRVDAATVTSGALSEKTIVNRLTLTDGIGTNRIIANPTDSLDGQRHIFILKQGGTGSKTVTWSNKFRFKGDYTLPILSTALNAVDIIEFVYIAAEDIFECVNISTSVSQNDLKYEKFGIQTITGKKTFQPSVNSASGRAIGTQFNPALIATANNDLLIGSDQSGNYNESGFTGVRRLGYRSLYPIGTDRDNGGFVFSVGNPATGIRSGVYSNSNNDIIFSTETLELLRILAGTRTLEYASDRSSSYTNRSVVDKEYADKISGITKRLTGSGNGSNTMITIPHGVAGITSTTPLGVTANSAPASKFDYANADATNIYIYYTVAPVTGTNNLIYTAKFN